MKLARFTIVARTCGVGLLALSLGCSRTPAPSGDPPSGSKIDAAPLSAPAPAAPSKDAAPCTTPGGIPCFRFPTPEAAFVWVLARDPLILAVGEAHAQKGTEAIASSTRRFTERFLPLVAASSSDVVVELWAPDAKCMKAVKQVASAQQPVTSAQASTNQNEYVTLGTKAKEAGMTPWLLRPTCDDFSMLADAGVDAVGPMLGLVKRLTQAKVTQLYERNRLAASSSPGGDASGGKPKVVIAYGGALHNDMAPSESMKDYTFGPELDRLAGGRYIELDLIVPEYVKKNPTWEKLPWFASFEADRAAGAFGDAATVYVTGEKSFVLVFPRTTSGRAD